MKVLIIVAHPRSDSLTMNITNKFAEGLRAAGHEYEIADLYRENFNPVLLPQDEPDWNNESKVYSDEELRKAYSDEVTREMERIQSSDAIVMIFPVWWYSFPAIMKGYIDRVWNMGFAYGGAKLPVNKIRWIPLVGDTQEHFKKRDYDAMIEKYMNIGIAQYIGVNDSEVNFMYNTLGEFEDNQEENLNSHYKKHLDEAYKLGYTF
ncbi:NAD(P)H oxidoreductase [Paenibacillus polymyxa]|uniref:NAD(P)H oxidoreductase n=1 Tax=Paenibacillus polymyxa TaxID=1406 RepID=UPI00234B1A78|nr:NAD(P)H oxidoreductase [Paenibacillus polymyxa]WCM60740.1 NAD(P)H oxidoreductase [Paenibacillus polymyxa]